jgi:hypothetical protein
MISFAMQANNNNEPLFPCNSCGRKFKEEALVKHSKICKKVFKTKRKKFDTQKKRILDSEHAIILKEAEKQTQKIAPKLNQIKQKKKQNWRIQSEILRNAARANNSGGGKQSGVNVNFVQSNNNPYGGGGGFNNNGN